MGGRLKKLLAPFVLRRKKIDVLGQLIPAKIRKVEMLSNEGGTREVYESLLSSHIKRTSVDGASNVQAYRNLFHVLRKAANHPLLLRNHHMETEVVNHLSTQLHIGGYFGRHETCTMKLVKQEVSTLSDYDIHCAALTLIEENPHCTKELERYTLQEHDLFSSPKMSRLKTLLPQLEKEGHRMLIFSQFTRCLDLLECLMEAINFKFLRLDGSTSVLDRQLRIDEFNKDSSIQVFLLSTRAGGMGINLTAADTCILHDLDFNPFNDLQAEDRCHRIGQKKTVTIIKKLITKGTVEEDIYEMQERKSKMNTAILGGNAGELKTISSTVAPDKGTKSTKENTKDMMSIVKNAMDRYLTSPVKGTSTGIDI